MQMKSDVFRDNLDDPELKKKVWFQEGGLEEGDRATPPAGELVNLTTSGQRAWTQMNLEEPLPEPHGA
eukprot:12181702-Heterocapsa_arctica.AAC.1